MPVTLRGVAFAMKACCQITPWQVFLTTLVFACLVASKCLATLWLAQATIRELANAAITLSGIDLLVLAKNYLIYSRMPMALIIP